MQWSAGFTIIIHRVLFQYRTTCSGIQFVNSMDIAHATAVTARFLVSVIRSMIRLIRITTTMIYHYHIRYLLATQILIISLPWHIRHLAKQRHL